MEFSLKIVGIQYLNKKNILIQIVLILHAILYGILPYYCIHRFMNSKNDLFSDIRVN